MAEEVVFFDRDSLPEGGWSSYRKTQLTRAMRIHGPFEVKTIHEGVVRCEDGYLAVDGQGYPYPVDAKEFARIYEKVEGNDRG